LNFGGEGIEAVAGFIHLHTDHSFLTRKDLHCKLVLLLLAHYVDEFALLESHRFTKIIVISGLVGVVIVDVAG
jgi:hypothetical protein